MNRKLLIAGAVFATLLLLGGWLVSRSRPDFASMNAALDKIPLPPGIGQFRINGTDLERDFYVVADCPGMTPAEVLAFYQDWFQAHGWTSNFPPGEEVDGLLNYQQGPASMHVTIIDVMSPLQVMVMYRLFPYTREEFDALLSEDPAPEVQEVFDRVRESYRSLTSYADTGSHETVADGEVLISGEFETKYVEPDQLLFVFTDENQHVLSLSGGTATTMSDYDDAPETGHGVSLAIASLFGVSYGTVGHVPELLLGLNDQPSFGLIATERLPEAALEDGTACIRVRGTDFLGQETTLWFGKADYLLQRIESVMDRNNRETTTYFPRANPELAPSELAFRTPATP